MTNSQILSLANTMQAKRFPFFWQPFMNVRNADPRAALSALLSTDVWCEIELMCKQEGALAL